MRVFMNQAVYPPTNDRTLYAHEEYELDEASASRLIAIGVAAPVKHRKGHVRVLLSQSIANVDRGMIAGHEYEFEPAEARRLIAGGIAYALPPIPVFSSKTA